MLPFFPSPLRDDGYDIANYVDVNPSYGTLNDFKQFLDAAHLLGANRLRVLMEILLPLARRAIFTGAVLCFTHTIGEFGVVLMIGGDIPGATRTLSIAMYDQVQDFRYAQANHTALLLLTVSLVALLFVYAWGRQVRRA